MYSWDGGVPKVMSLPGPAGQGWLNAEVGKRLESEYSGIPAAMGMLGIGCEALSYQWADSGVTSLTSTWVDTAGTVSSTVDVGVASPSDKVFLTTAFDVV